MSVMSSGVFSSTHHRGSGVVHTEKSQVSNSVYGVPTTINLLRLKTIYTSSSAHSENFKVLQCKLFYIKIRTNISNLFEFDVIQLFHKTRLFFICLKSYLQKYFIQYFNRLLTTASNTFFTARKR